MGRGDERLTIGEVAARTGLAVSAIRYYETRGLVMPIRNAGGQRRYLRSDIRRLSFVLIAQELGFPLEEIRERLARLPAGRTPTRADWTRMSREFRAAMQARIDMLTRMRDRLDGCIGCGCLSLTNCALYNRDDHAGRDGTGPRFILGEPGARVPGGGRERP
ncbi:MAG TPA: redox-sensitive transcriptional activator SoxR [Pseudomonadales bacterium]|nr:redox-sensitive transcriptional activator SoxR [Pseudomonadales bacterium]